MSVSHSAKKRVICLRKESSEILLKYADEKRIAGIFNDVIIKAGNKCFPANRLVLSCYSKFFETLFTFNAKEQPQKSTFEIGGIDSELMKLLIEFIYTGAIEIGNDNVLDILAASDYILLEDLKQLCFEFLESAITVDNCLNIFAAYGLYKTDASPNEEVFHFINVNFDKISERESLKYLSKTNLILLLQQLDGSKITEHAKYKALVNWVSFDKQNRCEDFPCLFHAIDLSKLQYQALKDIAVDPPVNENTDCLNSMLENTFDRFEKMSIIAGMTSPNEPDRNTLKQDDKTIKKAEFAAQYQSLNLSDFQYQFLKDVAMSDPLVKENPDCLNAVLESTFTRFEDLSLRVSHSKIICVGGNEQGLVSEIYNCFGKCKVGRSYPALPIHVLLHGSLKLKDVIFCIGGKIKESGLRTSKVFQLNLNDSNLKWTEVASITTSKSSFGAAVFQGNLIIAGGLDDETSPLSSAYMFEMPQLKWYSISSMRCGRYGNALVSCDGRLYAMGGYFNGNLSSVECLSDLAGPWKAVAPMQIERKYCSAVACKGFIYAIGGFVQECFFEKCTGNIYKRSYDSIQKIKDVPQKSVEKYNPKENNWTYVEDMNFKRAYHSACELHGKIYVVGGEDAKGRIIKEIDCYDPETNTWSVIGRTEFNLRGHALVLV